MGRRSCFRGLTGSKVLGVANEGVVGEEDGEGVEEAGGGGMGGDQLLTSFREKRTCVALPPCGSGTSVGRLPTQATSTRLSLRRANLLSMGDHNSIAWAVYNTGTWLVQSLKLTIQHLAYNVHFHDSTSVAPKQLRLVVSPIINWSQVLCCVPSYTVRMLAVVLANANNYSQDSIAIRESCCRIQSLPMKM